MTGHCVIQCWPGSKMQYVLAMSPWVRYCVWDDLAKLFLKSSLQWNFHINIFITMNYSIIIIYQYNRAWLYYSGLKISNWMHLSVGQMDCKNHLSECTILLSEIYKANATYVKIRNTQSSVGQVLQVFHLSDCHFYSSQMIGWVKFRTLLLFIYFHIKYPYVV